MVTEDGASRGNAGRIRVTVPVRGFFLDRGFREASQKFPLLFSRYLSRRALAVPPPPFPVWRGAGVLRVVTHGLFWAYLVPVEPSIENAAEQDFISELYYRYWAFGVKTAFCVVCRFAVFQYVSPLLVSPCNRASSPRLSSLPALI